MNQNNRRRTSNLPLLMLAAEVFRHSDTIRPVTLSLFIICVGIHYDLLGLGLDVIPLDSVCILPYAILFHKQLYRLITGVFFHGSDMHLYYNMSSLLYKGIQLETRYGSAHFGILVTLLTLISSTLMVVTSFILSALNITNDLTTCAVGISGVLFAMKVALFYHSDNSSSVMGMFVIPSKYVYWAELILIQVIQPNVSFLGHLCGILAGLIYVYGYLDTIIEVGMVFLSQALGIDLEVLRRGDPNAPPPQAPGVGGFFGPMFGGLGGGLGGFGGGGYGRQPFPPQYGGNPYGGRGYYAPPHAPPRYY